MIGSFMHETQARSSSAGPSAKGTSELHLGRAGRVGEGIRFEDLLRGGEKVRSSPAGIDVAVGQTQSASFATGTVITLSATNSRDVIWSGICSSNGQKTKTCTFTLNANASEMANVQ